jgi:hypothetical protein
MSYEADSSQGEVNLTSVIFCSMQSLFEEIAAYRKYVLMTAKTMDELKMQVKVKNNEISFMEKTVENKEREIRALQEKCEYLMKTLKKVNDCMLNEISVMRNHEKQFIILEDQDSLLEKENSTEQETSNSDPAKVLSSVNGINNFSGEQIKDNAPESRPLKNEQRESVVNSREDEFGESNEEVDNWNFEGEQYVND